MARIHGNRGEVLMDPTGGATVVAIASLNKWTLELNRDRVDVTCFQDTNKQSVTGLADYAGTWGGFWDSSTSPVIFEAILSPTSVMLHLVMDKLAPTYLFKGLANLDGTITVDANGAVSLEGKWAGAGPWVMEP